MKNAISKLIPFKQTTVCFEINKESTLKKMKVNKLWYKKNVKLCLLHLTKISLTQTI